MLRKIRSIFIVIVMLFLPMTVVHGEEQSYEQKLRQLNQLTDSILLLIQEDKLVEAKELLQHVSKEFLLIPNEQSKLTMTELQVVTFVYDRAYSAVQSVSMAKEERLQRITEFRLVLDALSDVKQPLWKQSEQLLKTHLQHLKEATYKQNKQEQQLALNQFIRRFEMIRPALLIDLKGEVFTKLDSKIKYLDYQRSSLPPQTELLKFLEQLDADLTIVFQTNVEDGIDMSLFWVILSIGGTIVIALTYAGWKKYKGEKAKVREGE